MKNLLIICTLIFSVLTVSGQNTEKKTKKEKRADREAQLIEQTKTLLATNTWQFDASQMLPSIGKSKTLSTPYNVVLKEGNVNSYLPYFGTAYSATYGGTESPMVFEAPIKDYKIEDAKKGGYLIKFTAKNKSDNVEFTFSVSSNGSSTLTVNSTNRQHISYYGDIVPIKEKKEKKEKE
jgi:hypothetical protein